MGAQQIASDYLRLADPEGKRSFTHRIVDSEHALFQQLTFGAVRLLGRIWRQTSTLLTESEIGVASSIGIFQIFVARERGSNPDFLARPIDVAEAHARRRLDQSADPDRRPEDIFRV